MARLLFLLPPERAHRVAMSALHAALATPGLSGLVRSLARPKGPSVEAFGLRFPNPLGIAAGFDKNATHVEALAGLGFGFVEIGSVTARPSVGNPLPRVWRLQPDKALVNRMGLNNEGAQSIARRLQATRSPVPLFVNVAKSHDAGIVGEAAVADYVETVTLVAPHADVVVLNVSCPNTGDGRTFEEPEALRPLLTAVSRALPEGKPWLVKVSPDLEAQQLDEVIAVTVEAGAHGFTATNTTVSRAGLRTPGASELRGGLSGAPLHDAAVRTVAHIRSKTDLPIVGVGGIRTSVHAQHFLDAGAQLVQLFTGFIYGGPWTARRVCAGLRP